MEFRNTQFHKLLKSYGFHAYEAKNDTKAVVVERLISPQWMCTISTLCYKLKNPCYYKVVSNQINSSNVKIKN